MTSDPDPLRPRTRRALRADALEEARAALRATAATAARTVLTFAPGDRVIDTVTGETGVIVDGQQAHHTISTNGRPDR